MEFLPYFSFYLYVFFFKWFIFRLILSQVTYITKYCEYCKNHVKEISYFYLLNHILLDYHKPSTANSAHASTRRATYYPYLNPAGHTNLLQPNLLYLPSLNNVGRKD